MHGDIDALLYIFHTHGYPPDTSYLFLGDYVDRGPHGVECMCLLLALRLLYPRAVSLLRGNHESTLTISYGFRNECLAKLGNDTWETFLCVFNRLPYAALLQDRMLCLHGGLSPSLTTLHDLQGLPRPTPIPDSGLVCDLMWSDPEVGLRGWASNISRGCSYTYGEDVVDRFCEKNDLQLLVRAHQIVDDGYEFFGTGRQVVTV